MKQNSTLIFIWSSCNSLQLGVNQISHLKHLTLGASISPYLLNIRGLYFMDTFSGLIRLKSYGLGKLNGTLSLKGLSMESKMHKVLSNADTVA